MTKPRESSSRCSYETIQEVQELKAVFCSKAEGTRELRTDALRQHEESAPGKELRENHQYTANQLTVHLEELQDRVKFPNDTREFNDLETASSSGPPHVAKSSASYSEFW